MGRLERQVVQMEECLMDEAAPFRLRLVEHRENAESMFTWTQVIFHQCKRMFKLGRLVANVVSHIGELPSARRMFEAEL